MFLTDIVRRRRIQQMRVRTSCDIADLHEQLWTVVDHTERGHLLSAQADLRYRLSHIDHEDPEGAAAPLVRLVAETEIAAATTGWVLNLNVIALPGPVDYDAREYEADLWRRLAVTSDRVQRTDLLEQIASYAELRVGWEPAQVLYAIARTERELAAAQAEGRKPKAPPTDLRKTSIAAGVFIGALFVCAVVLDLIPHLK